MNTEPDPGREDWIDFLYWLAEEHDDARTIVRCIEKPHQYGREYGFYLQAGGLARQH